MNVTNVQKDTLVSTQQLSQCLAEMDFTTLMDMNVFLVQKDINVLRKTRNQSNARLTSIHLKEK